MQVVEKPKYTISPSFKLPPIKHKNRKVTSRSGNNGIVTTERTNKKNKSAECKAPSPIFGGENELQASFNPKPTPFKKESFKSSTIVKRIPLTTRNEYSNFLESRSDYAMPLKNRQLLIRTDRYELENKYNLNAAEGTTTNQRERLQAEQEFNDKMKTWRRRREILNHRISHPLLLGGTKVEMNERSDITGELRRLKQVVLPERAKELYVGRGFKLPPTHGINKHKKLPDVSSIFFESGQTILLPKQPPPTAKDTSCDLFAKLETSDDGNIQTVFDQITSVDESRLKIFEDFYKKTIVNNEKFTFERLKEEILKTSKLTENQLLYIKSLLESWENFDRNRIVFILAMADFIADFEDEEFQKSFDLYDFHDFLTDIQQQTKHFVMSENNGTASIQRLIYNANLNKTQEKRLNENTNKHSLNLIEWISYIPDLRKYETEKINQDDD